MLTKTAIERAPEKEKDYLLPDGDGLYIRVCTTKRRKWVLRYWLDGKEKQLTFGEYPRMSIAEARRERDERKAAIRDGEVQRNAMTFGSLAERWYKERQEPESCEKTLYLHRLRLSYLTKINDVSVSALTRRDLIDLMGDVGKRHPADTTHRTARTLKMVLDYGVDLGEIDANPAEHLSRALPSYRTSHFAAATSEAETAKLLRSLDFIESFTIRRALLFIAYNFCRSGELREAQWKEIDFEKAEWLIPAAHTKLKRDQLVPLSRQAMRILQDMKSRHQTALEGYVFPAPRGGGLMGRTSLMVALTGLQLGLSEDVRPPKTTVHGFRSTASTLLHEAGFDHLVIERQLAHVSKDKVAAAYNRSEYIDKRRVMMQWWADFLDSLRDGTPRPDVP